MFKLRPLFGYRLRVRFSLRFFLLHFLHLNLIEADKCHPLFFFFLFGDFFLLHEGLI
jgi:hypothetical protein